MLYLKQQRFSPILRYFWVGLAAAIADLLVFQLILSLYPSLHYLLASTISFVIATWVNYWVGLQFMFETGVKYHRSREISLIYLVSLVGLVVHHIGFYIAVEALLVPLMLGKICGMGAAFFWNFSARYFWIFKK